MMWKRFKTALPAHGIEVLVFSHGITTIGYYDAKKRAIKTLVGEMDIDKSWWQPLPSMPEDYAG